jgi:hypothetical protein
LKGGEGEEMAMTTEVSEVGLVGRQWALGPIRCVNV